MINWSYGINFWVNCLKYGLLQKLIFWVFYSTVKISLEATYISSVIKHCLLTTPLPPPPTTTHSHKQSFHKWVCFLFERIWYISGDCKDTYIFCDCLRKSKLISDIIITLSPYSACTKDVWNCPKNTIFKEFVMEVMGIEQN